MNIMRSHILSKLAKKSINSSIVSSTPKCQRCYSTTPIPIPVISTLPPPIPSINISELQDNILNARDAIQNPVKLQDNKSNLNSHLQDWAQRGHQELQDYVQVWQYGDSWNRLKWWKLIWRVDDVTMITTDLVQRVLPLAEQELIFLCGQMKQAGLLDNLSPNFWTPLKDERQIRGASPPVDSRNVQLQFQKPLTTPQKSFSPAAPTAIPLSFLPYPQHLRVMRDNKFQLKIPYLQRTAQVATLELLSTTGLSGILGVLLYLSYSTFGLYQAGSVVALGGMFAVKRFQNKWESQREEFVTDVFQSATSAIQDSAQTLQSVFTGSKSD